MDPRTRTFGRLMPVLAVLAIGGASVLPAAAWAPAPAEPLGAPGAAPRGAASAVEARTGLAPVTPRTVVRRASVALAAGRSNASSEGTAPASARRPVAGSVPRGFVVPASIDVPSAPVRSEARATAASTRPSSSGGSTTGAGSYRGRNHVWIPGLGINRSVHWYACSRTTALDHVVYRWGCGGHNNVYLMGHASSVFKPLHDAYVSGRLRKGMKVTYADGDGRVRTYAVSFWKVTPPDGDVAWAYAAQSRPSLTLQTCVGKNNSHRLVVRLVATG